METRRRGVTLIEAILVLVVLATAATVGSFTFQSDWVAGRRVNDLSAELAGLLREARNTAIATGAAVQVTTNRSGGNIEFELIQSAGPLGPEQRWTVPLQTPLRVDTSSRSITFQPSGGADRTLRITVRSDGVADVVEVDAVHGQVTRTAS
ncbi:MAG: GspH/FimT family pseudopilin [Planctomycetota bacterium]